MLAQTIKKKKMKNRIKNKNILETVNLGFLAEINVGHLNEEISYYQYFLCYKKFLFKYFLEKFKVFLTRPQKKTYL